jgi:hypothetical protein
MTENLKNRGFIIPFIALILCAAAGHGFGRLIGLLLPSGILYEIMAEGLSLGLPVQKLSLFSWSIDFGFNIQLNLVGVLFILIFILIYRKG